MSVLGPQSMFSYFSGRVALLITNRNFADDKLTRKGAEKDEENMEKLLISLNYEVVKYNDLTGKVLFVFQQFIWHK